MGVQSQHRFIRVKQVSQKLGIGKSTVWYKVHHDFDFPSPIKLSPRVTVWDEADIDEYMVTKKQAGQLLARPSMVQ